MSPVMVDASGEKEEMGIKIDASSIVAASSTTIESDWIPQGLVCLYLRGVEVVICRTHVASEERSVWAYA